jgi:mannosylfructose-phosphate synthase
VDFDIPSLEVLIKQRVGNANVWNNPMMVKKQLNHKEFINSERKHILMLTTHGVHQWDVVPGLTDTGGQNIFVNQFTEELVHQGYRVTVANRGGYPHPITGKPQTGVIYKNAFQRIVYLEDGLDQFVRKEDMDGQVTQLAASLANFLQLEHPKIDLLVSHYWDAAVVGELFRKDIETHFPDERIPHVWVPHSLGAIKKKNVAKSQWRPLRIDERIQQEREILSKVDHVAATSPVISESLRRNYDYQGPVLWLPPCISTSRYHPREVPKDAEVWEFLSQASGLPVKDIQEMKIITEISRTDTTKRKDILLKGFALVVEKHPETLLVLTIEKHNGPLGAELEQLIDTLDIRQNVAVLGSVWDILPEIYAVSHLYCTPSVMEGFGMSAQEAAATGIPVVASSLVPFASQYLFGEPVDESPPGDAQPILIGQGAIIVEPDHVDGFAEALKLLLSDDRLRETMGGKAYQITIPRFTWPRVVEQFLQDLA